MLTIRPSQARGFADHGWLKSYHSFSFADYYDPAHMGWGNLRVINEDRIQPNTGFGLHPHQDMEIVSYVISGALRHQDSIGNRARIPVGDIQRMSAGTGITHSEHNDATSETHFLQIWLLPNKKGLPPSYGQAKLPDNLRNGQLHLLASDRCAAPLQLNADAQIFGAQLAKGDSLEWTLQPERNHYLFVLKGALTVNHITLSASDALLIADESALQIAVNSAAEILLFDLASAR